jgi:hypothetical protein
MAEFKLGRIRFVWKGDWTTATTYYIDDVIRYGARTYICTVGHTSSADFYTDLEFAPTKWNQMSDGQSWSGDWNTNAFYKINDVVKYGGLLYICNDSHTSAATTALGLEADQAKWTLYAEGFDWKDAWLTSTRYKVNDLVRYGGYTYVCNTYHTSAATVALGLEADQSKWDEFNQGIEYKGTWATATRYKINDVVKYGGGLWISTEGHTADAAFLTDNTAGRWTQFAEGVEYENTWNAASLYQPGDIVRYGGNQYIAKTVHTAASAEDTPVITTADWDLFSEGLSFQQSWAAGTSYRIGEVVTQNGYTYIATADSPSNTYTVTVANATTDVFSTSSTAGMVAGMSVRFAGIAFGGIIVSSRYYIKEVTSATTFKITDFPGGAIFNLTTATGTMTATVSAEPVNTSYWTRLSSGIYWRDVWTDDREYNLGDAVRFGSNAYICVLAHRSEEDDGSTIGPEGGGQVNSRPDQDVTGTYWSLLSIGSETDVLSVRGDLVYYSGAGPARLPIGREGQILRSNGVDPEWATLGETDHVYFVATHGTDLPAPVHGKTFDKPFKTIRYACEQVENGPRNPDAKKLLELNRVFVQREVTEFIQNQITNSVAPFAGFVYDDFKCERDIGLVIDAVSYDLCHGGNIKSRGAANSLIGGLSESETEAYPGISVEGPQSVAAYNYMLTVIGNVLAQTAPAVNYQTLNGDNSTATVAQYTNSALTAEAGALTTITGLTGIITDAITARAAAVTEEEIAAAIASVPARRAPNNLVRVATGRYREVLPIIVPEQTCVQGDELRSTNAGPGTGTTNMADAKYSIGALSRMETVVDEIITGAGVTESAGNTATQSIAFPYASADEAVTVKQLVRTIQQNIDFRLNSNILAAYTLPTGYNSSYLAGFGDARTLIRENRAFAKEELIAFIAVNFPTVKYSKTKCRRDVGYIIDALIYDLTYGGNSQSVIAALAYFDGPGSEFAGIFAESAIELTATIASYERLKTILQQIAANTTVSKTTGNSATQWTDTTNLTGGSAASSFIGANIDIIINILTAASTTGAPSVTVTSIIGSNTAVTGSAHGLAAGDSFTPRSTANGFVSGTTYWVLTAPSATEFTVSETFGGSTHTLTNGTGLSIVGDVVDRSPATNGVTSTTALITAAQTLDAAQESIVTQTTAYIAANFPTLIYNSAKCERDVRLILEAVMFDFMFNSNDQTLRAGYSYLRSTASDVYTLGQKTATRGAFAFAKDLAKANVGGDATAQARIETLMTTLDDVVFSGSNEGSRCATSNRMLDYAVLQLERNRDYIVAEIDAYIDSTYTDTVTAVTAATDVFTCSDTSWMQRNAAVRFTGTVFGGVSTDITYYIQNVVSATEFKIAITRNSNTALDISADDTGSMTVSLFYNSELCLRDVNAYIDALKYDLKYPGNYKSLYAARYYANAVVGSLEEDMYYLRDATGIRDQTLEGLTGDLLAPNEFGTSRGSAGAYCSLDPGWGPEDYRTWIITRSPYVQGVTTLGTACVGQKIDGALHNGGNDSIVSNDFTQVISDGIGAWVTNNGRAELVSVFSYYAHIGYLAENGGRIRGTNGNCSYGDFGAVAEGFDDTETPNTGIVDNRFVFEAQIDRIVTNGSGLLQFEFTNAGNDYTEATYVITGGGTGASVIQDEFRDDAVHNVRMLDLVDDSTNAEEADGNFGGFGYITNSNTAQGGTSTSVTIAATDGETSTAYIGMKIVLTGGAGVGQFGIITAYNSGTKVADVVRESTGGAGFDHMVPGTTLVTPDASTTYIIEPRVTFSAPAFTAASSVLPSSGVWSSTVYGETAAAYVSLTGTYIGSGVGATFAVIRNGWKYTLSIQSAGTGYTRLQTITIAGNDLGGTAVTNDLVITITAVNSVTGAILEFEHEGSGLGGRFVAVRSGSTNAGAYSNDGVSWIAMTLPSTGSWTSVTHGLIDDGSSIGKISRFVAVRSGSNQAAYSEEGITWTASTLPASADWISVAYGGGRFVAISTGAGGAVAVSSDGENWDITSALTDSGYTEVAYGRALFVAVRTGTSAAKTSPDGVTWTPRTLPAALAWNSVVWGNNKFVAVATDSNDGAISLDGATWTTVTLGAVDSSTAGYQRVRYGQGLFMATVYQSGQTGYSFCVTSEDGLTWNEQNLPDDGGPIEGYYAVAFGNPQRAGRWTVLQYASGTHAVNIRTGATAKGRALVAVNKLFQVNITEPGSGYDSAPTITFVDPNNTFEAPVLVRLGRGTLANPTFLNRGNQYVTSNAEVDISDGFAETFQPGSFVAVRQLTQRPVPGSNVDFGHLPGKTFKLVNIITFLGTNDGAYTAFFQISPSLTISEAPDHAVSVTTRLRYSQVRLTGHDFLDIGTGNFAETNYPGEPTQDPIPVNETFGADGGRVFFTATDQDGNFRVGDLFNIEQSTGIATLNADAFNISGLQELNLGNVTLGGGSATITEFSTDPFFTADSDNVVPTQRAIKAYIASQIGGGGASLNVNSVTAGSIFISSNVITTTSAVPIKMNATFEFRGGVTGLPIAFNYFLT